MRVDIPDRPELYHDRILKLHQYLNDLTDLFAELSNEMVNHKEDKDYVSDLKTTLNVVKDRKAQLSITKQMFNMIINKGSKYEDPPDPKKPKEVSDVPGQKDLDEKNYSNELDIEDLSMLNSNEDDFNL
jgi:hypothetical protein